MYSNYPLQIMKGQTICFPNHQMGNLSIYKDLKKSLKMAINLKTDDINIRTDWGRETGEEKESC